MDTEVALISDVIKFIETFICQFWKHLTSLAFAPCHVNTIQQFILNYAWKNCLKNQENSRNSSLV